MQDYITGDEFYDLWVLLRRTGHVAVKIRDRELSPYGLSSVRAAAINIVRLFKGKASPAEISRELLREDHTISYLLNSLEKEGFVKKTKDLKRKNMVRVALTKKGRTADKHTINNREHILKIMHVLSEEECRQMMMYLQRIRDKAIEELG
ncbi:MarR family winged helix-turn-helix transcriptional regulator [Chloroflexota bacterium]